MPGNFSILIVEDDDDARRNMEDILSLDGYRTRLESHCLTAISAIESEQFDAVILDWRLPDQNADSLLPIIMREQPETPVVVVTGMRDFDTSVKALRSGAYDFLLKPINPDVLRAVLSRLVERKKHLQEIQDGQEKLLVNERLAAIGEMVAGLAHESRNAFQRSHACLAELALDLGDKPDSLNLVHKVQKALDDVHQLLDDVRDYSAHINLERRVFCFTSLVRETWQQILDTRIDRKSVGLNMEVEEGFPVDCYFDRGRIQQVIRNLLENALFANGDKGKVNVRLGFAGKNHSNIRIEVGDNGDGVDDEHRDKIFAPFFTTKTKGTGLGLAVSRRIVDAHDGRIFLDQSRMQTSAPSSARISNAQNSSATKSEAQQGARFVIELPLRRKKPA